MAEERRRIREWLPVADAASDDGLLDEEDIERWLADDEQTGDEDDLPRWLMAAAPEPEETLTPEELEVDLEGELVAQEELLHFAAELEEAVLDEHELSDDLDADEVEWALAETAEREEPGEP